MERLRIDKALPAGVAARLKAATVPRRGASAALARQGARPPGQRGSVAVGMAVVLPLLLFSLAISLFLARVFWYYSVAHKAALDAARYLASAPQSDMHPAAGAGREARVAASARWIAESGTAALSAAADAHAIHVQCGATRAGGAAFYGDCGKAVPDSVRVNIGLSLRDGFFPGIGSAYFRLEPLHMTTVVTMRYAGSQGSQGGNGAVGVICC